MSNTKIKKYFFFLIIFYTIVDNFILSLKRINVNNSVYQFIQFGNDIFKNIRQKNKNKIYNNLVNYNVYVPNNCKISKINFDNKTIQLNKFPLKNYNIISIDYGYTFMGNKNNFIRKYNLFLYI